ncbi:MAG: PAS domain-containing protein [Acidobacteria bacterium]|nr:PAS domain-containing protein [Acidobacteriota bacterium]
MPQTRLERFISTNSMFRYGAAIVAAVLAVAARIVMSPLLGDRTPYVTVFATLLFVARYFGLGPAIAALATSLAGIWFWLVSPSGSPAEPADLFALLAFLLFSVLVIGFGEATRRTHAKQGQTEQALRESESRLRLGVLQMQDEIARRTSEIEQKTEQAKEQARLLDLANDAIFVRTARDRISYWNKGAERLYGWTKAEALGRLTHDLLRTKFTVPLSAIREVEHWQGELLQVKRDGTPIVVASRWTTLRNREGEFDGWLEINTDITARRNAEDAARRLSGRILSLQDDERRRIARELHDSLGQYLVSIKINLDLLSEMAGVRDESKRQEQATLLSDCLRSVQDCLSETRTISYLLHPPLLDEAGFASAARWYCEGFAERSGLQVSLDIPQDLRRLDRDVETTLFRILQESLTNVHRHSGGTVVQINLQIGAEEVHLQVSDNGKGIPHDRLRSLSEADAATGVGLAGMRERVRELGGTLEIASASPGTTIKVRIPIVEVPQSVVPITENGSKRSMPAA